MRGRVRKFSPDRRFGQIRPDGQKIDLFFHRDDVVGGGELCFCRGAHVEFVVMPDPKHKGSRRAAQVTLVEETPNEREKREQIQATKERGRQIRQEMDQRARFAQEDERRGRVADSDQKPAYIPDRDLEEFFLSVADEDLN